MRGHETPENHPLTILKGFSTVSVEIFTRREKRSFVEYKEGVLKKMGCDSTC
jgi:hypothetical protein